MGEGKDLLAECKLYYYIGNCGNVKDYFKNPLKT